MYVKVIRILSDPMFLIACYELIRGNPGNMTPGADISKITLDGIDYQ